MRRHVVTISKKNERTDLLNKTNMKKNNRIKTLFDPLVGFNRCDFLQRCFSTSLLHHFLVALNRLRGYLVKIERSK